MCSSIYELLLKLNEYMTILMITHDIGAISSYVKTVGCLNRRLHYHGDHQITPEMLEQTYQCPVDLIAHGTPHRVYPHHHS
jgi:zinc transport system ATP-binding protein